MIFSLSSRTRPLLVGAALGVLAALAAATGLFATASYRLSDRLFITEQPDPSIAIVTIDDASLAQIGRWPWPRQVHAQLIRALATAGAKVIAYDVNFSETSNASDDAELQRALRDAGSVVLPVELTIREENRRQFFDPSQTVSPLPEFAASAAVTGHTNTPPDLDGIVRRIPLSVPSRTGGSVPAFALAAYERMVGVSEARELPPGNMIIHFDGTPSRIFPMYAAADILRGRIDPAIFRDKAVFVGATAPDLHDSWLVSTSRGAPMSGVEIHASVFDTLLRGRFLYGIPEWARTVLLLALGLVVGLITSHLRARVSLPLALGLWLAIVLTAFVLFDRGVILDLFWPTLTLAVTFAGVTLERRIEADIDRRRVKAAFSRYVSPSVVTAIMNNYSKLKLGGERRTMTVLFSDVRGFTSLSEKRTPEELVEIMNAYLTRMTDIVFAYDGVLDKYIGDAVMAFWNAPFDQPDHARRAVLTALEMQRTLERMNAERIFPDGITLKIGVGVNTGEMIVGNMGSETRFDYTVIGDSVNLGSRLEGITKEYGVGMICTDETRRAAGEGILFRELDRVAVKGKAEPVTIFEPIGEERDVDEEKRMLCRDFAETLQLYRAGDFGGAVRACDTILISHPGDGPTELIRRRSLTFQERPPVSPWNGVWVMATK